MSSLAQTMNLNAQSEDFDIAGTLRGYLSMGYSNRNCIGESIDNVKDSKATKIDIYLYKDESSGKSYFVTSGNGNGLSVPQLLDAQKLQQWKNGSDKQGRFGYGYGVLRSVFSKNTGVVKWLSCHTDLNEVEKTDPYSSGKYAQIEIDMTQSVLQGRLVKTTNDELSRRNERFWKKFAADEFKTGTVVMIEMPEDKFRELQSDFNHPEPEKNISLGICRDYANIIDAPEEEDQVRISYNGDTINPLPRPSEEHSVTKKTQIWQVVDELNDTYFGANTTLKVTKYVTMDEDEDGNGILHTMRSYSKNNSRRARVINPDNVELLRKISTLESIFIHNIQAYFEENREFFENLGITDVINPSSGNVSQDLQAMIIADMVCRNNKMILIDPDIEKNSGNTNQYCCRDNVINIFHLDYSIYEDDENIDDIINNIDEIFAINVNKGMIYRRSLNTDVAFMTSCIKSLVNKNYFWQEGGERARFEVRQEARRVARAAQQALLNEESDDDDYDPEESEEELETDEEDDEEDDEEEDEEEEDEEDQEEEDDEEDQEEEDEEDEEDEEEDDEETGEEEQNTETQNLVDQPIVHVPRQAANVSQGHTREVVLAKLNSLTTLNLSDEVKIEAIHGAEGAVKGLKNILKDRIRHKFGQNANFIIGMPCFTDDNGMSFENYINEIDRYIIDGYNVTERSIGSGTDIHNLVVYLQSDD